MTLFLGQRLIKIAIFMIKSDIQKSTNQVRKKVLMFMASNIFIIKIDLMMNLMIFIL
jgi:hypothetical protein